MLDDRRAVDAQLQADHQAAHAQLFDNRQLVDQRLEPLPKRLAQLRGPSQQALFFDRFDRGDAGAGGDRIAAKRGRVHAGPQAGRNFRRRQHGAAGDAAAQALGQRHDIGRDADVLIGEPFAGAAAAASALRRRSAAGRARSASLRRPGKKSVGRDADAAFALDRLDEDRAGFVVDQLGDRVEVAERRVHETRPAAGRCLRGIWAGPWRWWRRRCGRESRRET